MIFGVLLTQVQKDLRGEIDRSKFNVALNRQQMQNRIRTRKGSFGNTDTYKLR